MGTKGLPHNIDVVMDNFKACLEDGTRFDVTIQSLTRKRNVMSRVATTKRGLNRVFCKFRVQADGVSCRPLEIDGVVL